MVWGVFDDVIRQSIRVTVRDKFEAPLQRHFDEVFGPAFREQANAMPQSAQAGRLMLRVPGYHLDPHRDPKHTLLTCLLYLARPGDSESYGTQIFRVTGDTDASYQQTYYPAQEGLVFLNSRGAHGATIPADAPAGLERYSYQFYVAPLNDTLSALIKSLPAHRRVRWRSKPESGGMN
jgi:hypothetical protein